MRKLVLSWIALALAVQSASPQTLTQPQAGPWAQKIFLGVANHDFGTVPRGAQLKHRFKMQNIYAVPLEITNIRSSCGCLSYTASTTKLKPQEEGYIDILMDGRRFTGPKSVTLYVTVGPQFVSTAAIQVTANARADVVFNPGEINFGIVRAGAQVTQSIEVEYAGAMDWRILEIVKDGEAPFSVQPQETYRIPGNPGRPITGRGAEPNKAGYRVDVTLKPDAAPGPFRHELLLKTNDPNSPVLTVVVEGNVQGALAVTPNLVRFGKVKSGETVTQKVAVRGTRPFRIVGIEGAGEGVSAELPQQNAPVHVLAIHFHPDKNGEVRRQLRIRTDLDDGSIALVTVEGISD